LTIWISTTKGAVLPRNIFETQVENVASAQAEAG